MTVRSNDETVILGKMSGIRETEPVIDDRLDQVHGMHDNPVGSLHRVPGKKLVELGVTSSVWSLTQLRFREGNVIVDHAGPNINSTRDRYTPGGAIPWIDDEDTIMEGSDRPVGWSLRSVGRMPFPEDVKKDNTDVIAVREPEPDPRPTALALLAWDLNIAETPTPINLDVVAGPSTATFTVGLWDLIGFATLKFVWTGDAVISIGETFFESTTPAPSGKAITYGFNADGPYPKNELFKVADAGSPEGNTSVVVTVTATDHSGNSIVNADGSTVETNFTVNVAKNYPNYGGQLKFTVRYDTVFADETPDRTDTSSQIVSKFGGSFWQTGFFAIFSGATSTRCFVRPSTSECTTNGGFSGNWWSNVVKNVNGAPELTNQNIGDFVAPGAYTTTGYLTIEEYP